MVNIICSDKYVTHTKIIDIDVYKLVSEISEFFDFISMQLFSKELGSYTGDILNEDCIDYILLVQLRNEDMQRFLKFKW